MNFYKTPEDFKKVKELFKNDKLRFGIPYLDAACGGILKVDLVIVSSKSGKGKTHLAADICLENAKNGKIVYYLALEAFECEIHMRMVYKMAAEAYVKNYKNAVYPPCSFEEYLTDMNIDTEFKKYLEDAEVVISKLSENNLKIFYRESSEFNLQHLEKLLVDIDIETDLIILDHIQYMDFDFKNQWEEISKIVKRIRDLTLIAKIPVVLISHINRSSRALKTIIQDQEDLSSTSDLSKIASKVIFISTDTSKIEDSSNIPTLFRVAKNRWNGSVSNYVGCHNYNTMTNIYEKKYVIGLLMGNDTDYEIVEQHKIPRWARCKNES